jgi:hypothetical protein
MDYQTTIVSYLILAILFTALLYGALKRNGRLFLEELFATHPAAGRALEGLLDIGYALFNTGYIAVAAACFPSWTGSSDGSSAVRGIAAALGFQMLLLSVAHGINVWLFSRKVGRAMRANQQEIEELLRS